MISRVITVAMLLVCTTTASYAQRSRVRKSERVVPVAEKHMSDSARRAIMEMMIHPSWIMGGNKVLFTTTAQDGLKTFHMADADKAEVIRLFDGREYAAIAARFTGRETDPMRPDFNVQRAIKGSADRLLCNIEGRNMVLDITTMEFSEPSPTEPNSPAVYRSYPGPIWKRYTRDGAYAVYCKGHNLYLYKDDAATTDSLVQLTGFGEPHYTFAMKSRGTPDDHPQGWIGQWFNDTHIGYTLVEDKRKVTTLTLVNSLNPTPQAVEYKFELPGDRYVTQYELWLTYADSAKVVKSYIGKFQDQEVKLVYGLHSPDALDGIYFTRKNRVCDTLELCRLDPFTGSVRTLITEVSQPIVNDILHACTPIDDGSEIIWWSERTGKGAFYLYDGEGNLKNPITDGSFVAGNILHLDAGERWMIIEGYGYGSGNPYYKKFFRVNLDVSDFTELTPDEGEHYITLSLDKRYLIDRYSTVEKMPRCGIRDTRGNLIIEIPMPDESLLIANAWNSPRLERVKAADKLTDLFGIIYTPSGFDPARKYPVVCNVYPGPQMDNIPLTFSFEHGTNQALADEGFIVLQFGYRGSSPLRGRDFYTYGYGNLRDYALEDCKYVVEQLAQRYACFDLGRIGIYGHSGGGFMSATAIMTYPDFFKVAVASSGNHDNNIYGKFWTEAYHGVEAVPATGPSGEKSWEFRSKVPTNMELAGQLKGRLMLITGDIDNNVHPAHTLRLANALIRANKKFDMMIIPGAGHEMGGEYYKSIIINYFIDHLKHLQDFDADMTAGKSQD